MSQSASLNVFTSRISKVVWVVVNENFCFMVCLHNEYQGYVRTVYAVLAWYFILFGSWFKDALNCKPSFVLCSTLFPYHNNISSS